MDLAQFMVAAVENAPHPEDEQQAMQFVEAANRDTLQWLLAQGGVHARYRALVLRALQHLDAIEQRDQCDKPLDQHGKMQDRRRRGP